MSVMKKTTIDRQSAEHQIWKACDEVRGSLPKSKYLEVALDMLLWARWIPLSEGGIVGYFDAMHSLADIDEWEHLKEVIAKRSGAITAHSFRINQINAEDLERMRASLLPISRALNASDPEQVTAVIDAMLGLLSEENRGHILSGSLSLNLLWRALLVNHPHADVACLFQVGVAAIPALGNDHPLLYSCPNPELEYWIRGLLSLYPGSRKPASLVDHKSWSVGIAAPAWGQKEQDLLIDDPWLPPLPLECPAAIRDIEARRVYAAHQRCSDTTYALVPPGMGFRTSRDMEYFREALIRNGWLDAVVALPSGSYASTSLKGLLLVLKKSRQADRPVLFVHAEDLLAPSKERSTRQTWDHDGANELACILGECKETPYSRLVTTEEMESNGFSFQVGRYLHSEAGLALKYYIESRVTLQLGDLAEIKRPPASLGRQEDDGVEVYEVAPSDIDDSGQLKQPSKVIRLPEIALAKGRQYLLESGDILMSIKGGLGKVAIVQDLSEPTVPGQAFCVIRLRPNSPLSPAALAQYLRSALGQSLLQKAGQSASVAFVPMGELKSLPVVIPSSSELRVSEVLERERVSLNNEIAELSQKLKRLEHHGWLQDSPQQNQRIVSEKYYTPGDLIELLVKEVLK